MSLLFAQVQPDPAGLGRVLGLTYLLQVLLSMSIDERYERGLPRTLFWIVWSPLVFWTLQVAIAIAGRLRALLRQSERGTCVSPDRGIR